MSWNLRTLTGLMLTACLAGCQPEPAAKKPKRIDMSAWQQPHAQAVMVDRATVVTEGRLPVVYQAIQGATVRVVDAVTGGTVATARLAAAQIIRVDEHGAFVEADRVGDGPLNASHLYRIVLEAEPDRSLGK